MSLFFFFSSRRRHTRFDCDWSSDVCSSDLGKWRDLFGATFDVLLYDLTSSYFEGEALEADKARRGYSRDHRPDCLQILLALVVTPEGFPLSYEVLPGNVRDEGTLEGALEGIERKHGKARRIWVFDRGVVSEANLEKLRERGAQYVVGTPRSQLKQYEQQLLQGEWQDISKEVKVDRKSTRLNSSHSQISYAVFCLKKKKTI